ncbi:phosphoribosylformylglycinamidine cyclo-ligase [Pantoea sp. Aalb]|uniref:phosphoribosylformylglycinamidine cyclo-ligase n=1 Tax=Pantoea sp. Aalb TaxID=2576762 RepID=UPI001328CB75|nr:phosphoribosylformylglycinamidine cyclo-ligase [Pantoea sp. Aalb]MXP67266.1 phosphoribosylformylglycinamidine cyclo-ligase [Pantoea sp. Aalb]
MLNKVGLTYADSGVNINTSNNLISIIKNAAYKTRRPEIIGELGGFNTLCSIPQKYREPILVSGTDGVGTKLRLAIDLKHHHSIGIDLVAMCVNDLVVVGAEPIIFLDYYATGKLELDIASVVITSIAKGCLASGCTLAGGETAEMPTMYQDKDYDIVGFCIGIVEKSKIINISKVQDGDVLIALASNGLHSNGYSLVRKVLKVSNTDPKTKQLDSKLLVDYLLAPTRIYVKNILNLMKNINLHAIAHITGGGFWENIPRILPNNTQAIIEESSWQWPPIFKWLQKSGNIDRYEMYRTFNCGVGMIIILNSTDADKAVQLMNDYGERAWKIGVIKKSSAKERVIIKP